MDQTQNTPPQAPKKSFWAKLFGGGKTDSTPVTPPSIEPATGSNPAADVPASAVNSPTEASTPSSSWSTSASPTVDTPSNKPSSQVPLQDTTPAATEPAIAPVPSWRDTPATTGPADPVPVPPSDPMVTPLQTAEPPTPVQPTEPSSFGVVPQPDDNTSQAPASDASADSNRPSITPPTR